MAKKTFLSYLLLSFLVLVIVNCVRELSNPVDPKTKGAVPPAPQDLKVLADQAAASITGSFSYKYQNADGILWERRISGEGWIVVDSIKNGSTFVDTGLDYETIYEYRIAGFNENGNSEYSNTASDTTAKEPDTKAPELELRYPLKDSIITPDDSMQIKVFAWDSSGMRNVTIDSVEADYNPVDSTFFLDITLEPGENQIIITAVDSLDNDTTVILSSITYDTTSSDSEPPVIIVTSPSDSDTVGTDSILVSGTVSDASGIYSLKVLGRDANIDTQGNWQVQIGLYLYGNDIVINAMDNSRNYNNAIEELYVFYFPAFGDSIPPTITITEPVNDFETGESKMSVKGIVRDSSGISFIQVIGVDTVLAGLADDTLFIATDVSIKTQHDDTTSIKVIVKDRSGARNEDSAFVNVIFDSSLAATGGQ
jgi:hypothetical protein